MLTPFYGDLVCDTFYFFCPNRLVWDHWEEFCGENKESAWAPTTEYTMPTIIPPEGGFAVNTLADYFGLPIGIEWKGDDELAPMALPFRMYAKIVDEFFRDENLTDPLLIPTDDANQFGSNGDNYITDVANGGKPFVVAKLHDYLSSCLPSPQKGPSVGIPIDVPLFGGGVFPVNAVSNFTVPQSVYPMVVGFPGSGADDVVSSDPQNLEAYSVNRSGVMYKRNTEYGLLLILLLRTIEFTVLLLLTLLLTSLLTPLVALQALNFPLMSFVLPLLISGF